VLVGLDDFKTVNDRHGNYIGDRVLADVAARLKAIDPTATRVYRLGGDEFVLLIPNCGDPTTVTEIAVAALKQFEPAFEIDEQRIFIGASAGVAVSSEAELTADGLIANADLARTVAKKAGQKYGFFVPAMRAEVRAREAMNDELRRAYVNREFVLYFQPQLRLDGIQCGNCGADAGDPVLYETKRDFTLRLFAGGEEARGLFSALSGELTKIQKD
jgi:diguanylate cyclase (GGDEF)-like protein